MRGKTIWQAGLLAAWAALAPGVASAQIEAVGYAPPDVQWPFPLYSTHPEAGGPYFMGGFVMYRQTNPIQNQSVAVRGLRIVGNSAVESFFDPVLNQTFFTLHPELSDAFIGPGTKALDVEQVSGPNKYVPGTTIGAGWKFADGSAFEVNWMWLADHRTQAVATLAPPGLLAGQDFSNTFLFSPVYNFPPEYAGPLQDLPFGRQTLGNFTTDNPLGIGGLPGAGFGIWNAAEVMSIEFRQRAEQLEGTYRVPVFDTECYRLSGLVGPRFFWIWERFKWRTIDVDAAGDLPDPRDVAQYTNIVSNRMYGVHAGCRQEWYMGHGFCCQFDAQAAGFYNVVHERVKYELGTKGSGPAIKRGLHDWTFVPELQGTLSLCWFPIEGVQFRIGYDVMAFFNTVSSPRPIDFNFSGLDPYFKPYTFRVFDGFQAEFALVF